ncbi:MAG: hypothetical protein H6Q41_2470, partial [Deltaproteobacteria bacterium]|nr:hypothetical protein [Deltaproteobacteria bacterium]
MAENEKKTALLTRMTKAELLVELEKKEKLLRQS